MAGFNLVPQACNAAKPKIRSLQIYSLCLCGQLPTGLFSLFLPLFLALTLLLSLSHVPLVHVHPKASPLNLHIREKLCCQNKAHHFTYFLIIELSSLFPPCGFMSTLFLTRHGLWHGQGLIYIVKATTVRDNLPTCKGLVRIDLQMK